MKKNETNEKKNGKKEPGLGTFVLCYAGCIASVGTLSGPLCKIMAESWDNYHKTRLEKELKYAMEHYGLPVEDEDTDSDVEEEVDSDNENLSEKED